MATTPEGRLTRRIMRALRQRGVFCFKVHGGPTMMAGLPDVIACVSGRFIGLEVKLGNAQLSPRQRRVHAKIREAEGVAVVVRSVDEAVSVVLGTD